MLRNINFLSIKVDKTQKFIHFRKDRGTLQTSWYHGLSTFGFLYDFRIHRPQKLIEPSL